MHQICNEKEPDLKSQEERRKQLSKTRRALFGKRISVLNNDFYEKHSAQEIEKYKKNGAISGCFYAL